MERSRHIVAAVVIVGLASATAWGASTTYTVNESDGGGNGWGASAQFDVVGDELIVTLTNTWASGIRGR